MKRYPKMLTWMTVVSLMSGCTQYNEAVSGSLEVAELVDTAADGTQLTRARLWLRAEDQVTLDSLKFTSRGNGGIWTSFNKLDQSVSLGPESKVVFDSGFQLQRNQDSLTALLGLSDGSELQIRVPIVHASKKERPG